MAVSLSPTRFQQAEHYCTAYAVVLPHDQKLEDALEPEFWAHVGSKLRQHDTIRVIPEDNSYFAELLVISADRAFAKVKLLRHIPLDAVEDDAAAPPSDFLVKFNGPHDRWSVIRLSDKEKLRTGFIKQADANRWVEDHLASMAH